MKKNMSYEAIIVKSFRKLGRPMKNILGAQIRAARALLRWAAADLVRELGVKSGDNPPCGIGRREDGDDVCQCVCHSQVS